MLLMTRYAAAERSKRVTVAYGTGSRRQIFCLCARTNRETVSPEVKRSTRVTHPRKLRIEKRYGIYLASSEWPIETVVKTGRTGHQGNCQRLS